MAIKAIINNTEKEIEQIKNSNEQDIDYVYSRIGDTEVEGESSISIKSIGENLANYRIYGNTVDGESVGDRTANLWDETIIQGGSNNTGTIIDGNPKRLRSDYIFVEPGETYSFASNLKIRLIYSYDDNNQKVSLIRDAPNGDISYTFTVPNAATKIIITVMKRIKNVEYDITPDDFEWGQLEKGSVVTSYEPYGYRVPVTVEGKNLCNNIWEQGGIDGNTGNVVLTSSIVCCDFIPVKPDVTYSCSRTIANDFINLRCYGANKNYLGTGATLANKGNPLAYGDLFGTFMITDARVSYIRFNDYSNALDTKYMLVEGVYTAETMPPYEPYHAPVTTNLYLPEQIKMVGDEAEYIDYAEQKQHRVRKNLLQNTATTKTINGVTFTVNDDGSIDCTRTNTQATGVSVLTITSEELSFTEDYILTGCPARGSNGSYFMRYIYDRDTGTSQQAFDYGSGVAIPKNKSGDIQIRFASGYNFDGTLTFRPMIRKADIEDDTYEPYIINTELDVTLPALSTIKGTNTLSVNTTIQPSNIYIKDNFDYKRIFTATRAIEDGLPLNYKNIEDNDSALSNYRIYGNGESVGDRTANLFDFGEWSKNINANGDNSLAKGIDSITITANSNDAFTTPYAYVHEGVYKIYVKPNTNYLLSWVSNNNLFGRVFIFKNGISDGTHAVSANNNTTKYLLFGTDADTEFITLRFGVGTTGNTITYSKIMLNEGSTALPYEPYGYRVPVSVTNGTDTETTNIYLPEQIKMVGDEAEYVDYSQQKQHRVRKNLWSGVVEQGAVSQLGDYISHTKCIRSKNVPLEPGTYVISSNLLLRVIYAFNDTQKIGLCASIYQGSYSYTITVPAGANNISIGMMKVVDGVQVDITPSNFEWGQVEKGSEVTNYEPYIENTDLDVTLPALPTIKGTNVLSVGTAVQPSKVYVKYKGERQ